MNILKLEVLFTLQRKRRIKYLFKNCLNINLKDFKKISYGEAIEKDGTDKPDTRFEMDFFNLSEKAKGTGFKIFDDSEAIYGFNIPNGSEFSRKIIDSYTDWVKRPQIGALSLIWVKHNEDGTVKSSIDKFF